MNKIQEKIKRAKEIIQNDENLMVDYFNKVPTNWIKTLGEEGLFEIPQDLFYTGPDEFFHHWPVAKNFLTRSAVDHPDETLEVMTSMKIDENMRNPVIISDLLEVTLELARQIAITPLVTKIVDEDWLEISSQNVRASFTIKDISDELIREKDFFSLSRFLMYVLKFKEYKQGDAILVNPLLRNYDYEKILDQLVVADLSNSSDLLCVLEPLIGALESFSLLEKKRKELMQKGKYNDYSFIWISKVFEMEEGYVESIPRLLVLSISKILKNNRQLITEDILDIFKEYEFGVFDRIRLYGYSLIKPELIMNRDFVLKGALDDYHNLFEWCEAIQNVFPSLTTKERKVFLDSIPNLYDNYEEKEAQLRQGNVLSCVKDFLTDDEKSSVEKILKIASPYQGTIIFSGGVKSGPNSPISNEELRKKDVPELLVFFKHSEKQADSLAWERELISPVGIARQFSNIIKSEPSKYQKDLALFDPEKILPTYIAHLLLGLDSGCQDLTFSLDYLDSLAQCLISKKSYRYSGNADSFDVGSEAELLVGILRFVESALKGKLTFNSLNRDRIFKILKNLRGVSMEKDENWIESNGKEYFTYSLNSTSGLLMHCLFAYMIWVVKNTEEKIPEEVLEFIHKQNDEYPENKIIRSVEGLYISNFLKDPSFNYLKDFLFPVDRKDLRYVAWETFLSRNITEEAFDKLKDIYNISTEELDNIPKREYWVRPEDLLVQHIFIGYLRGSVTAGELLMKLFKERNTKALAKGISFVGRAYISSGNHVLEELEEAELFAIWNTLLNANPTIDDTDLFVEFGWWIKASVFEDEEKLLLNLMKTLGKSKGRIEPAYRVLENLLILAPMHTNLISKILFSMVKGIQQEKLYFLGEEKMRELVELLGLSEDQEVLTRISSIRQILIGKGFKQYLKATV